MQQQHDATRLNVALFYRLIVGTVCTGALTVAFMVPSEFGWSYGPHWVGFWLYLLLAIAARFFSFEAPERRITLTLDTPIYLASVLSLGEVMGGLACFASLFVYMTSKVLHERFVAHTNQTPVLEDIARVLFAPSMGTTVLLALVGLVEPPKSPASPYDLYGAIALLGVLFVVLQYSLTGVYYVLRGVTWERFFKAVLLPGFAIEMTLVPIAILMVAIYDSEDLSPFMLLAAVFLLVNYALRNLSRSSAKLARQVRELAALNRLGQTICSTLERPQLVARIAQETLELFSNADCFCLRWTDKSRRENFDVFDRNGKNPSKFPHDAAHAFAELALSKDSPIQQFTEDGGWLAASIDVKGQKVGSLILWSQKPQAFHHDDTNFMSVVAQQAAIALENARLYELATVDSLTGLYVRRYFDDRLRDEVARITRYGGLCSLCLVDLDFLKAINDTHGHQAGDAALQHVAKVLKNGTRLVDIPARRGGDEFAVLFPNLDLTSAQLVADRLRSSVAQSPVELDGIDIRVSVSMGVTSFPRPDCDCAEDLIACADKALYEAKCTPGRNSVMTSFPGLSE